MSRQKSTLVTALVMLMLAVIDAGLLKLWPVGFGVLTGALAIYGYFKCAEAFSSWLAYKPVEYSAPKFECDVPLGEEFTATYESIKAEMEEEND